MARKGTLVLLTRPRRDAERFAAALETRSDVDVLIAPLMEILPIGEPVDTSGYPTLLFTSANAVPQAVPAPGKMAFCVGDATAAAARAAGFDAQSARGDAAALIAVLRGARPGTPILHLRGAHARGDVAEQLTRSGLRTEEIAVYRQADRKLDTAARDAIAASARVIAPVFSPRSAQRLLDEVPPHPALTVVAISPAAAEPFAGRDLRLVTASRPDAAAMLDTLVETLAADSPC